MNWDAEIRRKAQSGIALTNPNEKAQALYNTHQQKTINEIKRKSQEGVALTNPNEWANSIYNQNKPAQPSVTTTNTNSMVDNIYNNQKDAQLAYLKASRDKAIGGINQQRAEMTPQYQGMRNQSDIAAQQGAQKLREIMAANGLSSSGENVTANVGLQTQRQQNLNSLNLQEQQQNNDFDRRIADLNDPTTENAMLAALEAERAKALLGQYNADRAFGLQEGGLMGNYNGQRTLQGQGFDADQFWSAINQGNWQKEFDTSNEQWQWGNENLTAYQKAQIEQQNKARASSSRNSYNSGYEKAYEEFMKQMAEDEYLKEIERLRAQANAEVNRRNIPSNPFTNYRPQY